MLVKNSDTASASTAKSNIFLIILSFHLKNITYMKELEFSINLFFVVRSRPFYKLDANLICHLHFWLHTLPNICHFTRTFPAHNSLFMILYPGYELSIITYISIIYCLSRCLVHIATVNVS